MAVVTRADHSIVSVADRPTVIMFMGDGSQRAFTGVTCMFGGYAGGTLTVRHDAGTDTMKVVAAHNRYVPRSSVKVSDTPVRDFAVMNGGGDVQWSHELHKAINYARWQKETF